MADSLPLSPDTHISKIKGLNPATGKGKEKILEKYGRKLLKSRNTH
jgi:hypothetical protein